MTDLQSDFGRAFMMLAGYALEVLAKGLIIAKRPNEIQGDQWNKLTSGHDLVALLAETGITLKDPAQKFARRAASAVIWGGRYPVPKRKQADRLIEDFKWGWPSDLDVEMFDAMYRDLVAKFLEEVRRV